MHRWLALTALALAAAALPARAHPSPGETNHINADRNSSNDINGEQIYESTPVIRPKKLRSWKTQLIYVNDVKQKPDVHTKDEIKSRNIAPASDVAFGNETGTTTTVTSTSTEQVTTAVTTKRPSVNEQYPHAVLYGGTCGGTIISPKWVLTAAHCTLFTHGRFVLAGTARTDDGSGVSAQVKRLVVHPLFTVGPYWLNADHFGIRQVAARWDFMLVELTEALPLDGKTIAAAEINDVVRLPTGMKVGYGGFGSQRHGETMSDEMHGMKLEVLEDKACEQELVQYDARDMICTKGRPPKFDSACNGDSGSGLVANGTLYGVASWVQEDAHRCFNGALVIFSRISSVRNWIRQVTKL